MIMTDGTPVCDVCNIMQGPDPFIELWPAETRGPYGLSRVEIEAFHVCPDCIRERFAPDRRQAIARDRRHSQAGWALSAASRSDVLAEPALIQAAEQILRDAGRDPGSAA